MLKINLIRKIAIFAMVLSVFGALPLYASSVALTTGVNANVKVNVGSSASATGTANMSATGTARSSEAGSTGSSSASMGSENAADLDISAGKSGITITRSDVDGDDNQGVTVESTSVNDDASFSAFVKSKVKSDEKIKEVRSTESDVKVDYQAKAKFLGFIPFTTTVSVVVDNDGIVTVSYPWYKFLIAVQNDTELRANVEAKAKASADANLGAGSSVSAKAQMVEAIVTALQASVDASASADTSL